MKKIHYKRIFGLAIFLLLLSYHDVFAKGLFSTFIEGRDESKTCTVTIKYKDENNKEQEETGPIEDVVDFEARYGINASYEESGNLLLKIYTARQKKASGDDDLGIDFIESDVITDIGGIDNLKFKVVNIYGIKDTDENNLYPITNFQNYVVGDFLTASKSITINKIYNPSSKDGKITRFTFSAFRIELEPQFSDAYIKRECGDNSKINVHVIVDAYVDPEVEKGAVKELDKVVTNAIDCKEETMKKLNPSSLRYKFCEMRKRFLQAPNYSKKEYKSFTKKQEIIDSSSDEIKFKTTTDKSTFTKLYGEKAFVRFRCSAFTITAGVYENEEEYFINKSYIHGVGSFNVTMGAYEYNYDDCSGKQTEPASCKIQCEEYVEVEYGPPIATKAGLCFEYKVKVTSRVECAVTELNEPKIPDVCTPTPSCSNGGGKTHKQGGPDDSFDDCIKSCDGGKYTEKCSDKCYKKIYGESLNSNMTSTFDLTYADKLDGSYINNYTVTPVADVDYSKLKAYDHDDSEYGGKYTCSGGSISWHGNGCRSRWHQTHSWGIPPMSEYTCCTGNGIPKRCTCTEKCSWNGCKNKNNYLNYDPANEDYRNNVKKYYTIKKACENYAKCSTSTATFTISAGYQKKGKTQNTWIDFPYSTKGSVSDNITYPTGSTKKNANSTLLQNNGCYKDFKNTEAKDTRWYMTKWSFPGTYHNLKTDEISFDISSPLSSGWMKSIDKFCVPFDFPPVNEKWWLYYYYKMYGYAYKTTTGETTTYDGDCLETCVGTTTPSSSLNYNIKAITKKFGYFNWNIDVRCFYAMISEDYKGDNCTIECKDHKCSIIDGKYYGKDGTVVTEKEWYEQCDTKEKHICKIINGKYYGVHGKIVSKEVYDEECGNPVKNYCEEINGKYYGKYGTVVSKEVYEEQCLDIKCKFINGKYYGKSGKEVSYEEFKKQCDCDILCPPPDDPPTDCPPGKCPPPKDPFEFNFKLRSVKLDNLFPDKDGTGKSKTLPFNWSKNAVNFKEGASFTSSPVKYKEYVEKNAYNIYDDKYLDYEITLTRGMINDLKKKNKSFGTFSGNVKFESVAIYLSPLLRSELKDSDIKLPDIKALHCNNLINYKSTACADEEIWGKGE